MNVEAVKARWAKQEDEWRQIRDELPLGTSMHDITAEHQRRVAARGEKLVSTDEVYAAFGAS